MPKAHFCDAGLVRYLIRWSSPDEAESGEAKCDYYLPIRH